MGWPSRLLQYGLSFASQHELTCSGRHGSWCAPIVTFSFVYILFPGTRLLLASFPFASVHRNGIIINAVDEAETWIFVLSAVGVMVYNIVGAGSCYRVLVWSC